MPEGASSDSARGVILDARPAELYRQPSEAEIYQANPALLALPSGRLVAAIHLHGPGVKKLPGPKGRLYPHHHLVQTRIIISRDKGETWQFTADLPFAFVRLFRDGETLYALGHKGNLMAARSFDGGTTWSKPEPLTPENEQGGLFTQGPANTWIHQGFLYAAFMKTRPEPFFGWPGSLLCPVVLKGRLGANLLSPKAWTFSEPEKTFAEWFGRTDWPGLGIPFYPTPLANGRNPVGDGRFAPCVGWDDAHVLGIGDPTHEWYDPSGRSLWVVLRAGVHRSNLAVLLRLTLRGDERPPLLEPHQAPSGVPFVFLPWPGGHRKFDVLYDDASRCYWTAAQRVTDSLSRPAAASSLKPGLPADEARALGLYFSKNLVDWSFAGLLTAPRDDLPVQTGPAMAIRGPDLHVVFRSGGPDCRRLPQTERILAVRIPDFRSLLY
jgi:hypothetical protein